MTLKLKHDPVILNQRLLLIYSLHPTNTSTNALIYNLVILLLKLVLAGLKPSRPSTSPSTLSNAPSIFQTTVRETAANSVFTIKQVNSFTQWYVNETQIGVGYTHNLLRLNDVLQLPGRNKIAPI